MEMEDLTMKLDDLGTKEGVSFEDCKLNRMYFAKDLTKIVETYEKGFVLALDGAWGTGKTTFIKMWQGSLKDKNFQTCYFNAWENDFESSPLIAIMAELDTLDKGKNKDIFRKYYQLLGKLAVIGLNSSELTKPIVEGIDAINNFENLGKGGVFEMEVASYNAKKKALTDFKVNLSKLLTSLDLKNKPLVFIIDELDRCRPDYAVEVLEKIKHFFSIPGIVFVLAIDKEQLGYAIQGYYGSDKINSNEYLRRFIDLDISLPPPNMHSFAGHVWRVFAFKKSLENSMGDAEGDFVNFFSKVKASLRQIEKMFALLQIALHTNACAEFRKVTLFLVYLKVCDPLLYAKIRKNELALQEILDAVFDLFQESNNKYFVELQAEIANCAGSPFNLQIHNSDTDKIIEKKHIPIYHRLWQVIEQIDSLNTILQADLGHFANGN